MIMNSKKIVDFLNHTGSQKEVALIIAKDDDEARSFQDELDKADFRQSVDVLELIKRNKSQTKSYYIVRGKLPKEVYDFVLQYPTGQVEIFDNARMSSTTFNPTYKDTAVVLVITREALARTRKEGFQLLEYAGMAYQN